MNSKPTIPDPETRARSVAKLRELVKQMDRHIAELDELNTRLKADFQKSVIRVYQKKKVERLDRKI